MPSIHVLATLSDALLRAALLVGALGVACVAYGVLIERRWYRRAGYRLELLPAAASPVGVLHLSDFHLVRFDRSKRRFLASLPRPDICVVTGDILGEPAAVEVAVEALRPLRGRLASYFVLGSNDYYAPRPLSYAAYFHGRPRRPRPGRRGRSADLVAQLEADGWIHLRNRRTLLAKDGVSFEVMGMDDPHIERHDFRVAPRQEPESVGLAVVHSPEQAPELAALGYDLILTGHTHGGQVRLPFVGALVTNSSIPTRLCMGLSRLGRTFLHVSPGLGTSKYAPFRFLCRPEATLLDLVPAGREPSAGGQPEGAEEPEPTARSNTRS
ncbi:MAG: metallophosphoesterase [Actinomycetota bacterium]